MIEPYRGVRSCQARFGHSHAQLVVDLDLDCAKSTRSLHARAGIAPGRSAHDPGNQRR
jgi:hypothetical protein